MKVLSRPQGRQTEDADDSKPALEDGLTRQAWRRVKFGDVVVNVNANEPNPLDKGLDRYVGLDHLNPEDLRIKRWGNVADGITFTRVFRAGQVLFGKRRAYQRKVAVADFDGVCSGDILVFEAKPDVLVPELLPFIVQSEGFFQHALGTSAGSLSPRTKWAELAKFEFALPPKDEQRRIAEILWAAEQAIELFKESEEGALNLKNILLPAALFDEKHSPWQRASLADVCRVQSGQVDPRLKPYSDMIHIAADDIEANTGRIIERRTAAEDMVTSGNYYFDATAVLYSKIRPNLRKATMPDFEGVCSADMYPIFSKPNLERELLFYILLSEKFTAFANSHSARTAIPKLNRASLMQFEFNLPPLEEQKAICVRLKRAAAVLVSIQVHQSRLFDIRQNLLVELLGV